MYNKQNVTRRKFIWKSSFALLATTLASYASFRWWKEKNIKPIPTQIRGASANIGHLLRNIRFETPQLVEKVDTLIVGSGISGLSAARWLDKFDKKDFLILELEPNAGGNSSYGSNAVSNFPLAAHYIPLPNNNLKELHDFLEENGVIVGYNEQKLPIYNDFYLCFEPEERLYINQSWQEGLIPQYGITTKDTLEIKRFLNLMEEFRHAIGSDGKEAFAIPVDESSQDELFLKYDKIDMQSFLVSIGLESTYLHWYVDYCCKDDFGSNAKDTSAWAGIHYYAARKGKAENAASDDVLTWPEGNGKLMEWLKKDFTNKIKTNHLVYSVSQTDQIVMIDCFDTIEQKTKRYEAQKCIMATPQFVNQRIINKKSDRSIVSGFTYAPWMVANITINQPLVEKKGESLSWDNVIFGSDSLGYVCANHQDLKSYKEKQVLTYYLPLSKLEPTEARKMAINNTEQEWLQIILFDLEKVHKNLAECIENVDIQVWGHGMIRPTPNFIWGKERQQASKSINNQIFFAHTDLSGISIFEEAFYQGIKAAKQCLQNQK